MGIKRVQQARVGKSRPQLGGEVSSHHSAKGRFQSLPFVIDHELQEPNWSRVLDQSEWLDCQLNRLGEVTDKGFAQQSKGSDQAREDKLLGVVLNFYFHKQYTDREEQSVRSVWGQDREVFAVHSGFATFQVKVKERTAEGYGHP
jgi:hypothetical protein